MAKRMAHLGRGRRTRLRPLGRRLLIVAVLFAFLLLILNLQLLPLLEALAEAEAIRRAEDVITTAVHHSLTEEPTLYTDTIKISYRQDGGVASLVTDTARLLKARTRLSLAVLSALRSEEDMEIRIPLSAILGLRFLPSTPSLSLTLRPTKSLNAYFVSRFEEQGINQTRHSILFYLSIDVAVLIPGRIHRVSIEREFPFTETVIVGDVPDAYTKIDRLTDDITETELDDIYDFGATN
ncbi:MAG: sporulation protein YunB [Clostridia bacterium]|nr:sporulation protein YunB [Clostridia bacterium]